MAAELPPSPLSLPAPAPAPARLSSSSSSLAPAGATVVSSHQLLASAELERLIAAMRVSVPGLTIVRDKAASRFMRALNVIVRFFNARFMDDYVTTIGSTIYVPARLWAEPRALFVVLAHEWVHAARARGSAREGPVGALRAAAAKAWWGVRYLAPQVIGLGAPLWVVMAWAVSGGSGAAALWTAVASLAALAPWPSPWRVSEEAEAYAVSVRLQDGEAARGAMRAMAVLELSGWSYYRAAWRSETAARALAVSEANPCEAARSVQAAVAEIRGGAGAVGADGAPAVGSAVATCEGKVQNSAPGGAAARS